jgi:hypothetical protein
VTLAGIGELGLLSGAVPVSAVSWAILGWKNVRLDKPEKASSLFHWLANQAFVQMDKFPKSAVMRDGRLGFDGTGPILQRGGNCGPEARFSCGELL